MRYVGTIVKAVSVAVFALFSTFVSSALAGPNRVVSIDDQPVGSTLNHIYWIRSVDDNEGGYNTHLTHVFLIKQEVASSRVVRHWLVRRIQWSDPTETDEKGAPRKRLDVFEPPITENEGKPKGSVADEKLYVNPFEILRTEKAAPFLGTDASWANSELGRWKVSAENGLQYENLSNPPKIDEDVESDIRLSSAEMKRQLSASITPTLIEMVKFTPDDIRSNIPRSAFSLDLSSCTVGQEFFPPVSGAVRFMQVSCESTELINWWKLWVAVR